MVVSIIRVMAVENGVVGDDCGDPEACGSEVVDMVAATKAVVSMVTMLRRWRWW